VHTHAGFERAAMGMQARKRGEQRWMYVQHAACVALHELGRQHAHETGEYDEVRAMAFDFSGQRGIERCPVTISAMVHDGGWDPARLRGYEAACFRNVADNGCDRTRDIRLEQRFHVAASARDQHDDALERDHFGQATIV
jgi:hypothetical protein